MKAFLVAESIHQTLRLPLTGWPGRVRTAPLCRAKGPDSQQPPRAVQAGGTWPLPVSQSSWRGVDSGCGPARSSLCISRRRPRRAQRPPVLAPWRRARAARVLARSSRRQGFPARTHCPGEAGAYGDRDRAKPGQKSGTCVAGDARACGREARACGGETWAWRA